MKSEQQGNLLTAPSSTQTQASALSGSLALRSRGLVSVNTLISAYLYLWLKFLCARGAKGVGQGGTMAAVLFSLGGWATPPPSSELACNEMEMLSGLPGAGPALCSTD